MYSAISEVIGCQRAMLQAQACQLVVRSRPTLAGHRWLFPLHRRLQRNDSLSSNRVASCVLMTQIRQDSTQSACLAVDEVGAAKGLRMAAPDDLASAVLQLQVVQSAEVDSKSKQREPVEIQCRHASGARRIIWQRDRSLYQPH